MSDLREQIVEGLRSVCLSHPADRPCIQCNMRANAVLGKLEPVLEARRSHSQHLIRLHEEAQQRAEQAEAEVERWERYANNAMAETEQLRGELAEANTAYLATIKAAHADGAALQRRAEKAETELARLRELAEHLPDAHAKLRLIEDGDREGCADWCYACRLEKAEAAIERVRTVLDYFDGQVTALESGNPVVGSAFRFTFGKLRDALDLSQPTPDGAWMVAVTVPTHLSDEAKSSLYEAVADAAHEWEPDDRDGWDVDVTGYPTACRLHSRPDTDSTAR